LELNISCDELPKSFIELKQHCSELEELVQALKHLQTQPHAQRRETSATVEIRKAELGLSQRELENS
jgi:hypothetical protein